MALKIMPKAEREIGENGITYVVDTDTYLTDIVMHTFSYICEKKQLTTA